MLTDFVVWGIWGAMKKITDASAYARLLAEKPKGHGYTKTQIAGFLGISKQAITRWNAVPLKYVRPLSEKTGIPKADLLPSEFA
jgi:hypothetical protein